MTSLNGDNTALHFGEREHCVLASDNQVAVQNDLYPSAVCATIDGGDDRLGGSIAT